MVIDSGVLSACHGLSHKILQVPMIDEECWLVLVFPMVLIMIRLTRLNPKLLVRELYWCLLFQLLYHDHLVRRAASQLPPINWVHTVKVEPGEI